MQNYQLLQPNMPGLSLEAWRAQKGVWVGQILLLQFQSTQFPILFKMDIESIFKKIVLE